MLPLYADVPPFVVARSKDLAVLACPHNTWRMATPDRGYVDNIWNELI